jgi:hypothetical protein
MAAASNEKVYFKPPRGTEKNAANSAAASYIVSQHADAVVFIIARE